MIWRDISPIFHVDSERSKIKLRGGTILNLSEAHSKLTDCFSTSWNWIWVVYISTCLTRFHYSFQCPRFERILILNKFWFPMSVIQCWRWLKIRLNLNPGSWVGVLNYIFIMLLLYHWIFNFKSSGGGAVLIPKVKIHNFINIHIF